MTRIYQTLLAALLLTGIPIYSISKSDREFIEKYSVEKDVQAVLDSHVFDVKNAIRKAHYGGKGTHFVWTFDWLPGYFVKGNLARIKGMEKMKAAIKRHNLDLISVPDKRIYHIKGQPEELNNNNYVVVVKKVETEVTNTPLSLRQVQQLCTLIRATHYVSMTRTNYIRQRNERLCIIDTESTFDSHRLLKGFMRLVRGYHDLNTDFTQDALKYLFSELFYEIAHKPKSQLGYDTHELREYIRNYQNPRWDFIQYFEKNYPFA